MALIFPHEGNLRHTLKTAPPPDFKANVDELDLAGLCHNAAVKDLILKQVNAEGKKVGFKSIEILETVVLTPDEWTPESGLVTAAQKLQRRKITEKYKEEIVEAYKS
jgi:long-chain acyl-CoA synthetase